MPDRYTKYLGDIDSVLRTYGKTDSGNIPIKLIFYSTVFQTEDIKTSFEYSVKIRQNDVSYSFSNNRDWFQLEENSREIVNKLKKDIFGNSNTNNSSDFEKLVMLEAYKILKTS